MAQARRKLRQDLGKPPQSKAPPRAPVNLATGDEPSSTSPALDLQQKVGEAWRRRTIDDHASRWSPRSTLLLSGGVSLALWAAIATAAWTLVPHR
jgi:hypothetical protein